MTDTRDSHDSYQLVKTSDILSSNHYYYVDRHYQITNLPSFLTESLLIKTANDDKYASANPFLSFFLNQFADVYVALGKRVDKKPIWLNSFSGPMGQVAVTDNSASPCSCNKIYSAETVILGANDDRDIGAASNYVVLAK